MQTTLSVTHCATRTGAPLATIDHLAGDGCDMTPQQMRALADALQQAARECETLPIRRGVRRIQRSYSLAPPA